MSDDKKYDFVMENGMMIWKEHKKCLKDDCEFKKFINKPIRLVDNIYLKVEEMDHVHLHGDDLIHRIRYVRPNLTREKMKEFEEDKSNLLGFFSRELKPTEDNKGLRYKVWIYSKKFNYNWSFTVTTIDDEYIKNLENQKLELIKLME